MPGTKLICFDFDETIVNGHFHATMKGRGVRANDTAIGVQVLQQNGTFKNMHTGQTVPKSSGASLETIEAFLASADGLKNGAEMAQTIREAIDNNHKIAITSFTHYPEVVLPTLKKLGLEDKYIQQICIVGGYPDHGNPDKSPDGKEQHIAAAIQHFNNQGAGLKREDTMLVDDSTHNLSKVPSGATVTVPKDRNPLPTYFEAIRRFASKAPVEELSLAQVTTAEQLAGVIWNFKGSIINSQGVVMDNKKMASSIAAILSNKEMVAQIVANNGLTTEQVRAYGLTGAHGIYSKFIDFVRQKHEDNLRVDLFQKRIESANSLKEIVEIISSYPGELYSRNNQPLNKSTMIYNLEMIANNPARLRTVVDGSYQWGGAELTANYGLKNKIQECAQKEYIAQYNQMLPKTKDGLFKVEPMDWAKAIQYFQKNPSTTKCDKKTNGLNCSFIKVGDAIYAIKTGSCLGEGAFGKVKTVQNMNGENFAVKVEGRTKRGDLDSEVKIMKMLGELQGEADRVYGKTFKGQYAQNKLYTIMKLKEGNELFEELYVGKKRGAPRKDLPDSQRLLLAIKAAEAIKVLHDKNIIHADIKPENFMANVKGENIVIGAIDFGFSMVLAPGQDKIIGGAKGSPFYCAPEIIQQINGNFYGRNPATFSKASDLFAIGKMFQSDFGLNMGADFYNRILNTDPQRRPTMSQLLDELYIKLAVQPNLSSEVKMIADNYLRERKINLQELRDSQVLNASVQSANNLDALVKVINDYPWDIKNTNGATIDKQKMIAAMTEILSDPREVAAIVAAKGMSINAVRDANLTSRHGIYQKFMSLVQEQHQLNLAAKDREEAQKNQQQKPEGVKPKKNPPLTDIAKQKALEGIESFLAKDEKGIKSLYEEYSRSQSSVTVGRWMSNLHKDAGKVVFGKGKEREGQIKLLSDCIVHLKDKDPAEKAQKIYAILTKIESEIGREHNSRESGMDKMIKAQKQNLETVYPALKEPGNAAAIQKAGAAILREVRPAEEVKENSKQRFR